ncbi:MAG: uroporphyrinogen-III synthase [Planctomycetes bacterium]|nr:uroporphyrinogen-III synthase [Planctomycetota bacterium]NUQ34453.1 uroporphyrinogen-III synthase [Planctomycetaceae bacterium]
MGSSLDGIGVIITRAIHQSGELATMLVERGARVYTLPMIRFARHRQPDEAEVLRDIHTFDWIVFTSANAVEFFAQACAEQKVSMAHMKSSVASIGPATTAALDEHGLTPTFESVESSGKGLAKAFGEKLAGNTVLLPRSKRADDELPRELSKLGANVHELAVYDTLDETRNGDELRALVESRKAQALLFASPSAVEATMRVLGSDAVKLLSQLTIFSIGPATTKRCRECTIPVRAQASPHANAGLVAALERGLGKQ